MTASQPRVLLRRPRPQDEQWYLDALRRSAAHIAPWNPVRDDPGAFDELLERDASGNSVIFTVVNRADGGCAGKIAVNNIVRGRFQCAVLGYDAFVPYAGSGRMREALQQVVARCFAPLPAGLGLHRLEVNIQPDNVRSIGLAKRVGFRFEGFSPKFLYINDQWRDHERYALTVDEFEPVGF
ncbi:MAG: GNAT family N-acetyltransferase [Sporichthyaceae bacterium]|nr:GNAT family N-acetyltransferase [Sporichthyaceae bacterium]